MVLLMSIVNSTLRSKKNQRFIADVWRKNKAEPFFFLFLDICSGQIVGRPPELSVPDWMDTAD